MNTIIVIMNIQLWRPEILLISRMHPICQSSYDAAAVKQYKEDVVIHFKKSRFALGPLCHSHTILSELQQVYHKKAPPKSLCLRLIC